MQISNEIIKLTHKEEKIIKDLVWKTYVERALRRRDLSEWETREAFKAQKVNKGRNNNKRESDKEERNTLPLKTLWSIL